MRGPGGTRIHRLMEYAEGSGRSWSWLFLLLGWILCRNLLEGVLERPHQLGFDWREEISFAMMFLHFPIFYLALFSWLALWIHFTSGRPLACVLRALSLGFSVLLIAPVLDALASRGNGFDLSYTFGFGSYLWRFWDPGASLQEISPGQRVEIAMAMLLAALYTWAGRRPDAAQGRRLDAAPDGRPVGAATTAAVRGAPGKATAIAAVLGAPIGLFFLAAFLGAWPSLFARWTTSDAATAEEAYRRVYQLGGLIPSESRRHALVLLVPLLACAPLLLWRLDPARLRGLGRHAGWSRLAHYTGLVPAGAILATLVYREYLPSAWRNPTDFLALGALWAALLLAFFAALFWNALHDLPADRINAPHRPLPSGLWKEHEVESWARLCAGSAVLLSLCVSYVAGLLVLGCLFLAWVYSAPPLRLKRVPLLATGCLAALSVLSAVSGYSLLAQETAPLVFPRGIALLLFAGVTLGFTAKDLKDAAGDRVSGVVTLATLLPEKSARRWTAFLVGLGYLCALPLLPLGPAFAGVVLLFALASAACTLRLRRPDGVLLVLLAAFAAATLGFLSVRPGVLREGIPEPLLSVHGRTLRLEEAARASGSGMAGDAPESVVLKAGALIEREPLRPAHHEQLIRGLERGGRQAEALAACGAALGLGLRPGEFLRTRAALRLANGDAGPDFRSDLAGAFLFGNSPARLRVLLGDFLLRQESAKAALEAYEAATRLDAGVADAWAGQGEALHALHRLGPALTAFQRASHIDPQDPWILNNLGVTLRDLGRTEDAISTFRRSHELGPGLFEPVFNLALLCEQWGDPREAAYLLGLAARIRPGFPPVEQARSRVSSLLAAQSNSSRVRPGPGKESP